MIQVELTTTRIEQTSKLITFVVLDVFNMSIPKACGVNGMLSPHLKQTSNNNMLTRETTDNNKGVLIKDACMLWMLPSFISHYYYQLSTHTNHT